MTLCRAEFYAPKDYQPQRDFVIHKLDWTAWDISTCPSAQTAAYHEDASNTTVYRPLPCKQWTCRWCAQNKIRRLAALTREAEPNRFLTLTIDPKLHQTPRDAFDATRRQISPLFAFLRKRFGDIEYLRVTEVTKAGWPHYHHLVRSGYLPWPVVRDKWAELTGATIVDVRQIDKTLRAYTYLVKYLSKLHRKEWTDRHVSYSRGFFRTPVNPEKNPTPGLHFIEKIDAHPATFLTENFVGWHVNIADDGLIRLHRMASPSVPVSHDKPLLDSLPESIAQRETQPQLFPKFPHHDG